MNGLLLIVLVIGFAILALFLLQMLVLFVWAVVVKRLHVMNFNQRDDYRVSHELAHTWWRAMPEDEFLIQVPNENNHQPAKPKDTSRPNGPWLVLTRQRTDVAAVLVQALTDGSGQWGLAVLWYDREQCSRMTRVLRSRKLSRSKQAAVLIKNVVLQQGGASFAPPPEVSKI
jgi:hypothetical protein